MIDWTITFLVFMSVVFPMHNTNCGCLRVGTSTYDKEAASKSDCVLNYIYAFFVVAPS